MFTVKVSCWITSLIAIFTTTAAVACWAIALSAIATAVVETRRGVVVAGNRAWRTRR